jgi:hypothetical protein
MYAIFVAPFLFPNLFKRVNERIDELFFFNKSKSVSDTETQTVTTSTTNDTNSSSTPEPPTTETANETAVKQNINIVFYDVQKRHPNPYMIEKTTVSLYDVQKQMMYVTDMNVPMDTNDANQYNINNTNITNDANQDTHTNDANQDNMDDDIVKYKDSDDDDNDDIMHGLESALDEIIQNRGTTNAFVTYDGAGVKSLILKDIVYPEDVASLQTVNLKQMFYMLHPNTPSIIYKDMLAHYELVSTSSTTPNKITEYSNLFDAMIREYMVKMNNNKENEIREEDDTISDTDPTADATMSTKFQKSYIDAVRRCIEQMNGL